MASCYITTSIDDKAIEWRKPIDDPFIRHDVYLVITLTNWLKWPRIKRKITVRVDADSAIISRYFSQIQTQDFSG